MVLSLANKMVTPTCITNQISPRKRRQSSTARNYQRELVDGEIESIMQTKGNNDAIIRKKSELEAPKEDDFSRKVKIEKETQKPIEKPDNSQ